MKHKWVLSCAAAALARGLAATTAQAARHHRGASQFAPGHLQTSPGGAKQTLLAPALFPPPALFPASLVVVSGGAQHFSLGLIVARWVLRRTDRRAS